MTINMLPALWGSKIFYMTLNYNDASAGGVSSVVNVLTEATSRGYGPGQILDCTINLVAAHIVSYTVSQPALRIPKFAPNSKVRINLDSNSAINGSGGNGGAGGGSSTSTKPTASAGKDGGTGLLVDPTSGTGVVPQIIINNNGGYICGGGGGGGGGAGSRYNSEGGTSSDWIGGCGGSGGAGWFANTASGGAGYTGANGGATGYNGYPNPAADAGARRPGSTGMGAGGAGGWFGANGSPGERPSGQLLGTPGAGGLAGYAVDGWSYITWINTGNILGRTR